MKYKDKDNRIVIIILLIIITIITVVGVKLAFSIREENKLKDEVKEIKKHLASDTIDPETIKLYQNEHITTGERIIIEDAIEQYSYDLAVALKETNEVLNQKKLTTLLTAQSYLEDMPGFLKSKEYITTTKERLENAKTNLLSLTRKDTIESYLNGHELSNYNKKFYISLAESETLSVSDIKNFENAIDKVIILLDNSNELFNLLINSQGSWYVVENEVIFMNQQDLEKYKAIVDKIKGQM